MKLLNKLVSTKPWMTDLALLGLRVFAGFSMLYVHGWGKWLRLNSGDEISFSDPYHLGATNSLILAVFAELFCSLFLILGMFHRFAAFFLAFTMGTVVFVVKAGDSFGENEKAFLFLAIFVFLMLTGPGKLSLDQYMFNRKK